MAGPDTWTGRVQALLYPMQFEDDPMNELDRVFELVIKRQALNARPEEYLDAVRQALESSEELSKLLPLTQSEAKVRDYLAAVERRLVGELGAR